MGKSAGWEYIRIVGCRSRAAITVLLLAIALALQFAVSASAGLYHPKSAACAFGSDGASASHFANGIVPSIAFQQETRTLYVASPESPIGIFGFDASAVCPPSGYPSQPAFDPLAILTPPGLRTQAGGSKIAVDNTTSGSSSGNIYALSKNGEQILGYDAAGNKLSDFQSPKSEIASWVALAVDPSGNLWVADSIKRLHEFDASGDELTPPLDLSQTPVIETGSISSLAFDSNGDLYVTGAQGTWRLPAPAYDAPSEVDHDVGIAITVDRSSNDLYIATQVSIKRYSATGALIETFPTTAHAGQFTSITIDDFSRAVYAYERGGGTEQVAVFEALVLPDLTTSSLSGLTDTAATLNGTVDPDGLPLSGCQFEYVTEAAYLATGFADLSSGGSAACIPAIGSLDPSGGPQAISAAIVGLSPGVRYRFRISASNINGTNSSRAIAFQLTLPSVETVGSPIRTATTARLDSRIDPHGIATNYSFEYISAAAYQANVAASEPPFTGASSTSSQSAGSGGLVGLFSQAVGNLTPATTYHYRVVVDNGAFGGPIRGAERILTTRASDSPLSHGGFPGPVGSDRAWEQVSLPDTSGNPVSGAVGIAANGERAVYQVSGGTPVSEAGTLSDLLFAERPSGEHPTSGWQTKKVFPPRVAATFSLWQPPGGDDDLSSLLALNRDNETGSAVGIWRIPTSGGSPVKLYEAAPEKYGELSLYSENGAGALLILKGGSFDPAHPSPGGVAQLYDVSAGEPHMVSLLPGATTSGPSCGVPNAGSSLFVPPLGWATRTTDWVSEDGSRAFFVSGGESSGCKALHLYMRDLVANTTTPVDEPPVDGPNCTGAMIRSTSDSVYFWSQSKLAADDTAIGGACNTKPDEFTAGGDVYRYDLVKGEFDCLTCFAGIPAANVYSGRGAEGAVKAIALAPDGSRLYFKTRTQLLSGVAEAGTPAIYRVDVESGDLAYVGPIRPGEQIGENPVGSVGAGSAGSTTSVDGRFLAFGSSSPELNPLTGSNNGNTRQAYLYDDDERSLVCVSCPIDGSAPRAAAVKGILGGAEPSPNMTSLAENGDFAFATPTPLVSADQNTAPQSQNAEAGTDIYEWRDGRPLLVSDGLNNWPPGGAPRVAAISRSGRDLFFTEAAQLSLDALDSYQHLYDARIGGGMDFPAPPKPCPLEVCQGTPRGAPEEAMPGSNSLVGPGNVTEGAKKPGRCPKGKVRRNGKGRCVAKKRHGKGKHHKHQQRHNKREDRR